MIDHARSIHVMHGLSMMGKSVFLDGLATDVAGHAAGLQITGHHQAFLHAIVDDVGVVCPNLPWYASQHLSFDGVGPKSNALEQTDNDVKRLLQLLRVSRCQHSIVTIEHCHESARHQPLC